MTTAHKPTFKPSMGGTNQGGNKLYIPSKQYSSRDLPGHLKIKHRREGQGSYKDLRNKDFKNDLINRENKHKPGLIQNFLVNYEIDEQDKYNESASASVIIKAQDITSDLLGLENSDSVIKEVNEQLKVESLFPQDKDDSFSDEKSSSESEEKLEDKNEEDSEMEELMKEYEKIKKMREEEKMLKKKEEEDKLQKITQEQILIGNPLLNNTGYSLKKKWFEDTVFKNQAKTEIKVKKRFINDTVRSDFHRKFMSKYIQ